jgi:hypothetical protein
MNPEPDLLLPHTYKNDPEDRALAFFQCLQQILPETTARPSNAHIGTSCKAIASQWGPTVSVWPLCNKLAYVWPLEHVTDDNIAQQQQQLFYPPSDCRLDRFALDTNLHVALSNDKEVMFAARNANTIRPCSFLACPSEYDDELKKLLRQCDYGLTL